MPTKPPTFRAPGWKPAAKRKQVQDPFYQSPLWKLLRATCLARDGYRCTMAGCPTPFATWQEPRGRELPPS